MRLCILLLLPALTIRAAKVTIILDEKGQTVGYHSTDEEQFGGFLIRKGDQVSFDVRGGGNLKIRYFSDDKIGDGYALSCSDGRMYSSNEAITIRADDVKQPDPRAFYYNVLVKTNLPDSPALLALREQLKYYDKLTHAELGFEEKAKAALDISSLNETISNLQEEIKAYTAMSIADAVRAIERRQTAIGVARSEIRAIQTMLLGEEMELKIRGLKKEIASLEKQNKDQYRLLRAGAIPVGSNRKGIYYQQVATGNPAAPSALRHFGKSPVLTTADVPYIVVFGGRNGEDFTALRTSFVVQAGKYIDAEPVRPLVTQSTFASVAAAGDAKNFNVASAEKGQACAEDVSEGMIDRIMPISNQLFGETNYVVTVTGRGTVVTADQQTTGTTKQVALITQKADVKLLDSDVLPQVHSMYRYNLATGVFWTSLRAPSFTRVPTGFFYPATCNPTTAPATPCTPLYKTVTDGGGPRILPTLMFTAYWKKRDTQRPVRVWELIPQPTIGLSLTTPKDDFFLGGSSELFPLRNVQLHYGLHLGRIDKLSSASFQLPTSSSAPTAGKTLRQGAYVGLTFNIDFLKGLFK